MKMLRRALCALVPMLSLALCLAQSEGTEISAGNLQRLSSVARINYADLEGDFQVGWFATNEDASAFIIFDSERRIYGVNAQGKAQELPLIERRLGQVFTLLDAVFLGDESYIMYLADGVVFINHQRLAAGDEYVALFAGGGDNELIVETINAEGDYQFLRYAMSSDGRDLSLENRASFPAPGQDGAVIRIGRVSFPFVMYSSLADGSLNVYEYTDAFDGQIATQFVLSGGPAVFGALNGSAASHFAWMDPWSEKLNLLNLITGVNRTIAKLGGMYAQYLILSNDATAVLIVNLDFLPHVFAWDVQSGTQIDLGPYRECDRIPDMVRLSKDGSSLIIGCDSGLDIWRIGAK